MHKFLILFFGFASLQGCMNQSSNAYQIVGNNVEDVWQQHPHQLRSLINALDLNQPGLAVVKKSLIEGDTISSAKALLSYYKSLNRDWIVSTLDYISDEDALRQANCIANDSVVRQGISYAIPNNSGKWQWDYTGPEKDDEFGYGLNGHKYLYSLMLSAELTGESNYISVFDQRIKDWIIHHPLPEKGDSIYIVLDTSIYLDYRDIGEVEWRTLETGHRLGVSWPQTFYGLQDKKEFSDAARLLMLSSLAEQCQYLTKYHKFGHNWTTMEMNGLALAGLSFPEFKEADHWANYALEVMKKEINRQVYPDGVQTEISSKTQWVALNRFETLAVNFEKAGHAISEEYLSRVEAMYEYLAYTVRPDGHQPLNNDSDRDDLKDRILKAAKKFNRPDWEWIITNGKGGTEPKINPSVVYPWVGIQVMRNGWDNMADWTFFDVGPYGTGHQHRDMLHVSIHSLGKDLLVDGGRYTHKDYFNFDPAFWRGYFRSSYSHNVILVDGNGQKAGPLLSDKPLVEGEDYIHSKIFDYAGGKFESGFEENGREGHSLKVSVVFT